MTVTVIALVTINEDAPEDLAAYLKATDPLLASAGAKIVQRFKINEVVVGKRPAKSVVVVTYPNREAVDQVFGSEAYKNAIPHRERAFTQYQVSVVET